MKARNSNRSKTSLRRVSRRARRRKLLLIAGAVIILPLIGLYFFVSLYYHNHFFSNTSINGIDASNMTLEEAEDAINAEVKSYRLTIEGRNDIMDAIYGENIGLHTVFEGGIERLLEEQNAYAWPLSLMKSHELSINTMLEYDESILKLYIDQLSFFDEANVIEPENAYLSEYGENGYEIIPENPGAKIKKDMLEEAIVKAILSLEPKLSIEEAGCYEKPELLSDYPLLVNALNELNRIAGAKITYEFGEVTEVLDGSQISKWLSVDDNFKVHFEKEKIKEFVDYIGKTYNTFGKAREFKTSYGDVITVKGGDYGWWLNRAQEESELGELIESGSQVTKIPAYYQTAQRYGEDDIGDTYVEINLTAQHLFFYHEGELIVETDFVSGNVSKNYGTPTGTYPIQYKERNATLVGEDYETPVEYWMPFNRNIGLHDAPWRSEFGKNIYLTRGSHGCINMPPKAAKKVYEKIQRGVAVIVYELPGTENYEVKDKATQEKKEKVSEVENNESKIEDNADSGTENNTEKTSEKASKKKSKKKKAAEN